MKDTNQEPEGKPVVMLTTTQLAELVRIAASQALEEYEPAAATNDGLLDRNGAAKFLNISLTTLDLLSKRGEDPIPYRRLGDSKRFCRVELREWFLRQKVDS
jgi:hypothetical protein